MAKASQSTISHSLSLAEPVGFLFLHTILIWFTRLHKLTLRFLPFLSPRQQRPKTTSNEARRVDQPQMISMEDVEIVMGCMGMACGGQGMTCGDHGEELKELISFDELSNMFEEKEPSLEEVKAAFCVFDENCDGFIDAMELQRVLSKLGFTGNDGLTLAFEACKRMIATHDENQDGRIDFNEFVKFMESSAFADN